MSTSKPNAELSRGLRLTGGFQVDERVGKGALATVYRAFSPQKTPVAIKLISLTTDEATNQRIRGRLQREADVLGQLQHKNIVRYISQGEYNNAPYLVLEYLHGPRVADLVKPGPMAWPHAVDLIQQVCAGLSAVHAQGLVHGDIKLSNLMVHNSPKTPIPELKIIDFDLAREVNEPPDPAFAFGTAHTMSPEQVQGMVYDTRADIYSVGVVLYRLVAGCYPIHGPTTTATKLAHISVCPPPIGATAPQILCPPGLQAVLDRCLLKQPEERFSTVQELSEALQAIPGLQEQLSQKSATSWRSEQSTPMPTPTRQPRDRSQTFMAAVLIVVFLALIWWVL